MWVADFHRPETDQGRITVLSPEAKVLAYLPVPSKVVSNITFGGADGDEIFCTTGDPPGVFHAKVGVKGFRGHPGQPLPISRYLNAVTLRPHADAAALRQMAKVALEAPLNSEKFDAATARQLQSLAASLTDPVVRRDIQQFLPQFEAAAVQHARPTTVGRNQRLRGEAKSEIFAPKVLRSIASDEDLPVFGRLVEISLNERTDGHSEPEPRACRTGLPTIGCSGWPARTRPRRLEVSGTAITSAGLVHLGSLRNLQRLNICLTAVDDRGLEHLASLDNLQRLTVCASKVTGTGFRHLLGLKNLESINLHSMPVSDAGLAEIGRLKGLRRLEIVHVAAGDAGLAHLAELVNL